MFNKKDIERNERKMTQIKKYLFGKDNDECMDITDGIITRYSLELPENRQPSNGVLGRFFNRIEANHQSIIYLKQRVSELEKINKVRIALQFKPDINSKKEDLKEWILYAGNALNLMFEEKHITNSKKLVLKDKVKALEKDLKEYLRINQDE